MLEVVEAPGDNVADLLRTYTTYYLSETWLAECSFILLATDASIDYTKSSPSRASSQNGVSGSNGHVAVATSTAMVELYTQRRTAWPPYQKLLRLRNNLCP